MNVGPNLPSQEESQRMRLYEQGLSDPEIAKICFLHPRTVQEWRQRRGLPGKNKGGRRSGKILPQLQG